MVSSKQVDILFHRGTGLQHLWGFGSLAHAAGRIVTPFLRKFIVPAAKCVGTDLLEFVAPEFAEVLGSRRIFKTATKSVWREIKTNQLSSKKTSSSLIPTKSAKRSSRSRRDIFATFCIIHVDCSWARVFLALSENLGRKVRVVGNVLSSHEQEIYPPPHAMKTA